MVTSKIVVELRALNSKTFWVCITIRQPHIHPTEIQPPYFITDASHNTVIMERYDIMGQNHAWRSGDLVP
jgi:hypothetical protein